MNYRLLFFMVACSVQSYLVAQSLALSGGNQVTDVQERVCLTVENETNLQAKYPSRLSKEEFESKLASQITRLKSMKTEEEEILYIPVIVHVIYNGEDVGSGMNISAEQVNSQFDVLNDDYRRTGAGYNDNEVGADIRIEFYPATEDPDGNTLDEAGIDRVDGGASSWTYSQIENTLKPETYWDPDRYYNIWVLNFGGSYSNVLGYAQFPSYSGLDGLDDDEGEAETDGIVISYLAFGTTGTAEYPYDGGRTATHETGHWLGLRHTWGDGDCTVDDYCDDTPDTGAANYGCPTGEDSCPDEDGLDMIDNYMDYTYDACMDIMTQDQKDRIRTVLAICPRRYTLLGALCSDAEEVTAGVTNTTTAPDWYYYIATADQVVTVSSVGYTTANTLLSLYSECGSDYEINYNDDALSTEQSELSVYLEEGDTVKIYWSSEYTSDEFSWALTISDLEDGNVCNSAVAAVQGENTLPATDLDFYWYYYVTDSTYSKVIIEADSQYYAYTGNCLSLTEEKSGTGTLIVTGLAEGDTVWLMFETNGGDFVWTLNEEGLKVGEDCEVADAAIEGTNTADYTPFWYTFTMPEYGDLSIVTSGLTTDSTYLEIYDGCDGSTLASGAVNDSDSTTLSLNYGDEIKIFWDSAYNTTGFDWIISIDPIDSGSICAVAYDVEEGTIASTGAPMWYKHTMTASTGLLISSVNLTTKDTYLFVYTSCGGEVVSYNDDADYDESVFQSRIYLSVLNEGETIYIYWSDRWNSDAFDWEIIERDNNAPTMSDQTFTLNDLSGDELTVGTVQATDADGDGLFYSITDDSTGVFSIGDSTGILTMDLADWDASSGADMTLTVEVTDGMETADATITITIVLGVEDEASEVSIYPNPSSDQFYIQSGSEIQGGELLDLSGKSLKILEAGITEVSTADLNPGIYLLRLNFKNTSGVYKVIVD